MPSLNKSLAQESSSQALLKTASLCGDVDLRTVLAKRQVSKQKFKTAVNDFWENANSALTKMREESFEIDIQ